MPPTSDEMAVTGWRLDRLEQQTVSLEAHARLQDKVAALEEALDKQAASLTWAWRAAVSGIVLPFLLAVLVGLIVKGAP
jgi:hypothetical protein